MRVLLTGASGMLGKHLLAEASLFKDLYMLTPARRLLDLLLPDRIALFLANNQVDVVIHAAARVGGIQANIKDPVGFIYENMMSSFNLIHACFQAGIQRLLFVGSSCMYPKDLLTPLRESQLLSAPLEPTNEGYALAKISAARLCAYFNKQHGTHYKTLIPCNLYGAHDHFDPARSHLVAAVLVKLHRAKVERADCVEIWGDGSARREFLYVADAARFMLECLPRLDQLDDLLNVGASEDHQVRTYYQQGAEVVGFKGDFTYDLSKPVGMKQKLLDSSLAQSLGWRPRVKLRDGLARTYRSFLQGTGACDAL